MADGNMRTSDKDLYELLDQLQATIEQAKGVPFSDNCLVDRADALYWIKQIRASFPSEVQQAKWIVDQQRQVVASARQKAESIQREAEQRQAIMVDEHQVTIMAKEQSQQILTEANRQAEDIYTRSIDYARKRLTELENVMTEMLVRIQKDKKELK
ncbi:MAG: hypothetical protein IK020_03450 [Clostridiales bacterium]|nr:hypothetical protein [Clostridiales bacterium]MBR5974218.1 hypothetical protein [Clostridiales bacterium]